MILENQEKLSKKESLYQEKLVKLNRIDVGSRTDAEKKKLEEKEEK